MAEIVQSLFGVSPESYQQAQQQRADAQALQYAQLTPFQQANYAIGRGANMLGGAIGGALGGQDPELQRITRAQQIASQIDFTDPQSFKQGMAALGDDTQSKLQLAQIFRQQQESGALIGQRNAAAQASIAQATRERGPTGDVAKGMRVGEITRALQTPELNPLERIGLEAELSSLSPTKAKEPTTNEITNAAAFAATKGEPGTPAYTAAFQSKFNELIAPKEAKGPAFGAEAERVSKAKFGKPFADLTPAEAVEVNKDLFEQAKATAPSTTVKLPPQQSSELSERGKLLVADYKVISETARVGQKTLPALESNLSILDKGFDTGFGTATQAVAARVLGALGVQNAKDFATNADVFLANASSAVLQKQLEQKGPQTEADAQRITQTGAQLGNTKEANKFLLTVAREQIRRDVEQAEFYRKWFVKNKTYDGAEDAWLSGEGGKSLFERPALRSYSDPAASAAAQIPTTAAPRAAAPAASAPMYARNPQTNKRVMSTDGGKTWNPVR
jgi:hypothetical protein